MENKLLILTIGMLVVLVVSIFGGVEFIDGLRQTPDFFVGVEVAYANSTFQDMKDMVDKVKGFTNLFVVGSPEISFNETLLNQTCDYVYDAGLNFIVLFTTTDGYRFSIPYVWIMKAKEKYSDKFLAVYRYDEPGGNQLDNGTSSFFDAADNYSDAAANYVSLLNSHIEYYSYAGADVVTADYGLYWFDYKGGYDAVLADFGFNHSRELNVALCRGAARAQKRDWGAMVTWKYSEAPFIESGDELYDDLTFAYRAGAKYAVVFDYPKVGPYGLLTDEHFDALKRFWDYTRSNPQEFGVDVGEAAYVVPRDYGFGFRSSSDTIWGLFGADELSPKVWSDVNKLVDEYGSRFDVVYDDPMFVNDYRQSYGNVFFWNETVP